jgi:hypothetical protein
MKKIWIVISALCLTSLVNAQSDTLKKPRQHKNVIRYNLTGPMVFGWGNCFIIGYERVIWRNHSVSVNGGTIKLPRLLYLSTDLFDLQKDESNAGYNFSADYRYYPLKDNKHPAPRGVYIGPYYSYNLFTRETVWSFRNNSNKSFVTTNSEFAVSTVGIQLGYQFILWKRIALDFVVVGPGCGFYRFEATLDGTLAVEEREDLLEGAKEIIVQKFPGADFIFSDKKVNANGVMNTTSVGYRYVIHVGINF